MAEMIQTASDWAERVITIWAEKMASLGVSNAWAHAGSFAHYIHSAAGGNVSKIEFAFEYFLKFTDMGVGKGVSLADRNQMSTSRIQKQWYSKTFLLEVRKLTNMLASEYGHQAVLKVVENINDNSKQ